MVAQAIERRLHLLVMAGGSGTRFWPKSRQKKPKQLLALWDDKTLLEHTLRRFEGYVLPQNRWIVTTKALVEASRSVLKDQCDSIRFLGESQARNTAACILWSILEIRRVDPQAIVIAVPADHYVADEKAFRKAIEAAVSAAMTTNGFVTLGVRPDRPETGYGYIKAAQVPVTSGEAVPVERFVEKPDFKTAVKYVESGQYLWNAGMFMFRVESGYDAYKKTMPRLTSLLESSEAIESAYSQITPEDAVSVDYGVMENAEAHGIEIKVVPAVCGWNDVGSFKALEDIDHAEKGDVVSLNANCNIVQSDSGIVALLGVNDLIVIRDGDVVLVAAKDRAQDIKFLLDKVKASHPETI